MPTYEYACTSCNLHVEVVQKFSDDPLEVCGVCGGRLRRVFHPAGVLFKGSGFYSTENRSAAGAKHPREERPGTAGAEKTPSGRKSEASEKSA